MHFVALYHAPAFVALGVNTPSQRSIMCSEYHCDIPSLDASRSATLPSMDSRSDTISFSIEEVRFLKVPVSQLVIEVAEGAGEEDDVGVGIRT